MSTAVVLPRFLAFKANVGTLLIISKTGKTPMLEYTGALSSLTNMWNVHEVIVVDKATGTVAIRYLGNGLYWQRSYDNPYRQYVVMASLNRIPGASDRAALFVPVQLTNDTVALRNVESGHYCDRRAYNFLLPAAETIIDTARMTVVDPVLSRTLADVVYHTDRSHIHSSRVVTLASVTGINNSSLVGSVTVEITYTQTVTTSWNNSVTVGLEVTVAFHAGVPLIVDGKVEVSASVSNTTAWGQEKSETTEVKGSYTVPEVPPGHRVRVTVSGTEAKCDVPFSYTQRDTLPDGLPRSNSYIDGVFNGANVFSIVYEARDVDADGTPLVRGHLDSSTSTSLSPANPNEQ